MPKKNVALVKGKFVKTTIGVDNTKNNNNDACNCILQFRNVEFTTWSTNIKENSIMA